MSILNKLNFFSKKEDVVDVVEERQVNISQEFYDVLLGRQATASGILVNPITALDYAPVYSCVDRISSDIASLSCVLYRRTKDGNKEYATDHALFSILKYNPNPNMSIFSFFQCGQVHLLTFGNFYCYIQRGGNGKVQALHILNPACVTIQTVNGQNVYLYTPNSGQGYKTDTLRTFTQFEILHVRNFSLDGTTGVSPVAQAREIIALGMVIEKYTNKYFSNGTTPSLVLRHPQKLDLNARKNLKSSFNGENAGVDNAHKFLLLDEGMEVVNITTDPDKAQLLQAKEHQIADISRIFKVPLHLLNINTGLTAATKDELTSTYWIHTIKPWIVLWEMELNRALLRSDEKSEYFFRFKMDESMRGSATERATYYKEMFMIGCLSQNKILAMEDQDGIGEAGDKYYIPLNMIDSESGAVLAQKYLTDKLPTTKDVIDGK